MNWEAENIMQIYKRKVAAKDAEIERLRALVGEMTDALAWCNEQAESIGMASLTGGFQMGALTMTMAGMSRRCNNLVAKAKEVVK